MNAGLFLQCSLEKTQLPLSIRFCYLLPPPKQKAALASGFLFFGCGTLIGDRGGMPQPWVDNYYP